jgi:hypothetical protein
MTKEEIMEMARQAGLIGKPTYTEGLEMFAKLVAEKERAACAKVFDDMSSTNARLKKTWNKGCRDVAIEIRARGQQ